MIVNKPRAWTFGALVLLGTSLFWACKTEEKLPELGDRIAGPVDVATSPSGNYFYALNSDYERRYSKGSILVIDPETTPPTKVAALPVQRLGRSMDVAQNLMLVTFDPEGDETLGHIELWDLKDEKNPALLTSWNIECSPANGIIAPSEAYFAVSCLNGNLFMGHLNRSDLAASTLDFVRAYGYAHRALYFYERSGQTWLLGFPSDMNTPEIDDQAAVDRKTYDLATEKLIDGADEVPDSMQDSISALRKPSTGFPFQMFIYDVTAEEAASPTDPTIGAAYFRYIPFGTFSKPTQVNTEMRFVYYTVLDVDGLPDKYSMPDAGTVAPDVKAYRSNFWMAKAPSGGPKEVFYLSQRGNAYGSPSNNVLRVEIKPEALAQATSHKFPDIFKVERVYGFSNDRDSSGRYPGAFAVTELDGEPVLLVNHFRDLINFQSDPFYGITRKFLNPPFAMQQATSYDSTGFESSFYQLAVSASGKLLTGSFYGHSLYLFDVRPRTSMRDQIPIRIE